MRSIILFFLFLSPILIHAQYEVKGKVMAEEEAIGWANIVLLNAHDEMVQGTTSDEDGMFNMNVDKGNYKIQITFLGLADWEQEIQIESDYDMGIILLKEDANTLDDVVVTARRKLIEHNANGFVFNVENSVAATGGNGLDVLKVTPGINVQNNSVQMIGRGASQVMVNGRLLPLSGDDLIDFLNSLSSDDIKKIAIIKNPSAQFDAEGNGGLIDIILKKGVQNSWKNSTTFSHNQNTYFFQTLKNNFYYSKDKINFSLSANGTLGHLREIEQFDVYFPSSTWEFITDTKKNKESYSGRIALDYQLSPKTSIGGQYYSSYAKPRFPSNGFTNIYNEQNQLDSTFVNKGDSRRVISSQVSNLHLISNLDSLGRQLSLDVDFFNFKNNLDQDNIIHTVSPENTFIGVNYSAQNKAIQQINNFSGKAHMDHPLKAFNLSYGAKVSFLKTENDFQNYRTASGYPVLDTSVSNLFEYTENIQAIYVNASKEWKDKWSLQLGLRLENSQTKGLSKTLDQTNKNQYIQFFPSLYLGHKINDKHRLSFNYGRRISRPNFRDLNPFRVYANSSTYSEGNPFIQPSYTHNFDLNYHYNGIWTGNFFMNYMEEGFGTVFMADPSTNVQAITRRNFYDNIHGGIGQVLSLEPTKWWSTRTQVYLLFNKSYFDQDINALPQNGLHLYASTNQTFHLGKNSKIQMDFWYSSAHKSNLFDIGDTYSLNIGFQQSLFKNKLQLTISLNDVLNSASLDRLASVVNGVETIYSNNYSSRYGLLSLSYQFGNKKLKTKGSRLGNEENRRRSQ